VSSNEELTKRWAAVMMPNYGVPPIALARGEGTRVWDADGRDYLDLYAGIAVSSLGHAHPAVVEAVSKQVATIAHTSNLLAHEPGIRLAERLLQLVGSDGRVFFCQDGTEANEAALKLARRHGRAFSPSRTRVVAAEGAFHGRTMGSLSITGTPAKREAFEPLPGPVTFVPYGDVAALDDAVDDTVAAVFLETTLGEGGILPAPQGYLAAARKACDRTGALLVIDEVQSGIGRTGHWFTSLAQGVQPDVITLAKGLAGGLPLGACIGLGAAGTLFQPGDHGSTFGGNPVSCAAALAVLDTIENDDLLTHVKRVGERWVTAFDGVRHPLLASHRGSGLWRGLVLTSPRAGEVEAAARTAGFLVNAVQPDVVRLAPPLILSESDADVFSDALPGILDAVVESDAAVDL
jgi:acetylornithine/N-succinyldiaminopimelate aminotransferase